MPSYDHFLSNKEGLPNKLPWTEELPDSAVLPTTTFPKIDPPCSCLG